MMMQSLLPIQTNDWPTGCWRARRVYSFFDDDEVAEAVAGRLCYARG